VAGLPALRRELGALGRLALLRRAQDAGLAEAELEAALDLDQEGRDSSRGKLLELLVLRHAQRHGLAKRNVNNALLLRDWVFELSGATGAKKARLRRKKALPPPAKTRRFLRNLPRDNAAINEFWAEKAKAAYFATRAPGKRQKHAEVRLVTNITKAELLALAESTGFKQTDVREYIQRRRKAYCALHRLSARAAQIPAELAATEAAEAAAEAAAKAAAQVGCTSEFAGVGWDKRGGKWAAGITHGGRRQHLGYFADEAEAARAVEARAQELGIPLPKKRARKS
jgi:hypothetical protein